MPGQTKKAHLSVYSAVKNLSLIHICKIGPSALAVVQVANTITEFLQTAYAGVSNASTVIVGQAIGQGKIHHAVIYSRRILNLAWILNVDVYKRQVQNIAMAGDHIVSASNLYGGTYNLFANTLKDQGLAATFVDPADPDNFEKAIQPNTKLIYAETLGNPNADVIDIEAVADVADVYKRQQ